MIRTETELIEFLKLLTLKTYDEKIDWRKIEKTDKCYCYSTVIYNDFYVEFRANYNIKSFFDDYYIYDYKIEYEHVTLFEGTIHADTSFTPNIHEIDNIEYMLLKQHIIKLIEVIEDKFKCKFSLEQKEIEEEKSKLKNIFKECLQNL